MANSKKNISSLHINGMDGRIMRLPASASKKRQILLLYGHHASLERMNGLAETLNTHGAITMPDLPGLGGMSSFYSIGEKPTLDNYADYLASIVKLYFKRHQVTIIAFSFSVPLVVRMLQKYPELATKVEMMVSISGFVNQDEFTFNKKTYYGLRVLSSVFSKRLPAALMANTLLTKPVIAASYKLSAKRHSKMKDAGSKIELDRRIAFEVGLWKMNDLRTRMSTIGMMLTLNLCEQKVPGVTIYHVTASQDRYFDNEIVTQHLHVIFDQVELVPSDMPNHAPSIMATAKEAAPYVPLRLQKILG